jgi:hypothetical protein
MHSVLLSRMTPHRPFAGVPLPRRAGAPGRKHPHRPLPRPIPRGWAGVVTAIGVTGVAVTGVATSNVEK